MTSVHGHAPGSFRERFQSLSGYPNTVRSEEDFPTELKRLAAGDAEAAVEVQLDDRFQRRNVVLYVIKPWYGS